MQVGIAGAGAIAVGYGAFLTQNGHSASLWSPTGGRTQALLGKTPIRITGAVESEYSPSVCIDAEQLAKNDVIVLALPAYGHRFVLDSLLAYIEPRHTVIISSHLSFAALYLAKGLAARGIKIPIVAWSTTILTCKAQSSTEFKIGAIRSKVDMAVVPVEFSDLALDICNKLFGYRFILKDDIISIALSNLNPQNHMGIALCNLTRIERGEAWGQNSNITSTVGNLLERLDRERLAIASAFGKSVRTIFDHFTLSFGVSAASVAQIAVNLSSEGNDPPGPKSINSRYVLEDVPFGLVSTIYLSELTGVASELHRSGVALLSACYGRELSKDNDLIAEIGPLDRDLLAKLVVEGYPVAS